MLLNYKCLGLHIIKTEKARGKYRDYNYSKLFVDKIYILMTKTYLAHTRDEPAHNH